MLSNLHYMSTHTTHEAAEKVRSWLSGRLPDDWFESVTVTVDREEITIVGTIAGVADATPEAESGRIRRFREDTREKRIEIALELQAQGTRKVAWGVTCGDTTELFTRLAVPVMTRLTQADRQVLDLLVESGVARSRSDALAWCVRLVRSHESDWLSDLSEALEAVRNVRRTGPGATA